MNVNCEEKTCKLHVGISSSCVAMIEPRNNLIAKEKSVFMLKLQIGNRKHKNILFSVCSFIFHLYKRHVSWDYAFRLFDIDTVCHIYNEKAVTNRLDENDTNCQCETFCDKQFNGPSNIDLVHMQSHRQLFCSSDSFHF